MITKNKTMTNSIICYSLIAVIFVVIRILSSPQFHIFDFLGTVGQYILNAVAQIGILFCISIFMFKALQKTKTKEVFKFYGYKKISWKGVLYSILLGIIVYIINVFVVTFFSSVLTSLGYSYSQSTSSGSYPFWLFLINVVTTAILPAVCEETAHRGMLLRGLSSLGARKAIIISSLLFGLMHMNIEQFFYTTIIGLFLGYLTMLTNNIYPAIIIHFMNNFLSTFMSFSRVNNLGFDGMFTWLNFNLEHNPVVAVIFIVALLSLLFILVWMLIKALFKETVVRRMNDLQDAVLSEVIRDSYFSEVRQISKNKTEIGKDKEIGDIEKLVKDKAVDTGNFDEISTTLLNELVPDKPSVISRVLIICCFVLMSIVTLMTFIWGVFL